MRTSTEAAKVEIYQFIVRKVETQIAHLNSGCDSRNISTYSQES